MSESISDEGLNRVRRAVNLSSTREATASFTYRAIDGLIARIDAAEAEVARLGAVLGIARRMATALRGDGCTCRRITYDEAYHELHEHGCPALDDN